MIKIFFLWLVICKFANLSIHSAGSKCKGSITFQYSFVIPTLSLLVCLGVSIYQQLSSQHLNHNQMHLNTLPMFLEQVNLLKLNHLCVMHPGCTFDIITQL